MDSSEVGLWPAPDRFSQTVLPPNGAGQDAGVGWLDGPPTAVGQPPASRSRAVGNRRAGCRPDDVGSSESSLYATFLGRFTVCRANAPLALGRSRTAVQIAQYLMARGRRPIPREELVEWLWPEVEPVRATHRLHVAISELRHVLDPAVGGSSAITFGDDAYSMTAGLVTTDTDLFEERYDRARRCLAKQDSAGADAEFRAAVDLYRGDFLEDEPFAEWAQARRAHFAENRLTALTFLCEHAAEDGRMATVLEDARQILEIDNLRERAHRHLMRAHYALGQRACALRQYLICAAILDRELGVLPSQPTQELHRAIQEERALPGEVPLRV